MSIRSSKAPSGRPTFKTQADAFNKQMGDALKAAGYPAKADPAAVNWPMLLLLLTILVFS